MAKNIMIQGTASSVGKSIITAGLCRIFFQDGEKVAPFKSQNMALNSFVTDEGHEMGRAQVVQAEACGLSPSVLMNPILLKPTSDKKAQVILNGRVFKNMYAVEYHTFKKEAKAVAEEAYSKLDKLYDIIVLEGAGSPAEINLRENDIVNMGMAEIADAPVVLVADIDRGGVFASIVGTMYLLTEEEKKRVKGVIINKFRGDVKLLEPGLKQLEDIIKIPVLGVIPYLDVKIEDEDSVTEKFKRKNNGGRLKIDVIKFPRLSNFTDFDIFDIFDDVSLNFVSYAHEITDPDIIILPGTKNTIYDLNFIKNQGIDKKITELYNKGKLVIGICGGFQMLGKIITDPHNVEGNITETNAMGLINMETELSREKITTQVTGEITSSRGPLKGLKDVSIKGYEIHMGLSSADIKNESFLKIKGRDCGVVSDNLIGTYVHGIFDNTEFTQKILNNIRGKKGLPPVESHGTYESYKEVQFNKLAESIKKSVNMKQIYNILDGKPVECN